ncbi:MAG: 2OG-Fe dioxygenase family protein [Fidelibacterota bacterium]
MVTKRFFDSYYFDKSVWHSVSPVESLDGINEGYRDVLLLDFVPRG